MAINIILPPKPVVLLSVESGGSLQASTTYYFRVWWQGLTMPYYGGYAGESSDEVSITTTSTDKSIRMRVSWDNAAISAFADAGSGNVTVTSTGHGLVNGEEVYINSTTNYDGEYTVANSQTNTFDIVSTFVTTEAGHWYGVGPPTRATTRATGYLFMWDTATLSGNIPWNDSGGTTYGHRKWYGRVGLESGINATNKLWTEESGTQLSSYDDRGALCSQRYVEHPQIGWTYSRSPVSSALTKKAKFCIEFDGGTHTWADAMTALKADSRVDGMYVSGKRSFIGFCAVYGKNSPAIAIDGYNITLLAGAWNCAGSNVIRSSIFIEGYSTWVNPRFGSLKDCKIVSASSGALILDNISNLASEVVNAVIGFPTKGGTASNYAHNVEGFTVYNTWQLRYIAAIDTAKNMTFLDAYFMATRPAVDATLPDWENLKWDYSGVTSPSLGYDIRWEFSSSSPDKYTYINLLNPDTDRSGGKIINYTTTPSYTNYDFKVNIKFTFKINVIDTNKNTISTAHVLLKDKNDNIIIDTDTDATGDLSQDIISYYQYFITGSNYLTTVDNGPFTVVVSKIGYIPYTSKIDIDSKYDEIITLKTFTELPAHKVTATKIKRGKITP